MNKKKILISAVFIFVASFTLIFTGCPQHIDSLYGIKVVGDGTGGAIIVYEDKLGGNIYVQKISPDGKFLWGQDGVLLGRGNKQFYSFQSIHVVSDGSEGAIISWPETISQATINIVYHISKVDASGQIVWQRDYDHVITLLISDGSGGVIASYSPDGQTLVLIRIDSSGNLAWGEREVLLSLPGSAWQIASDGVGGAVIAWKETQYPSTAEPGTARAIDTLFAQRVDVEGEFLWGNESGNGMLVYKSPENVWIDSIEVTADGLGGVVLTYYQVTEDPTVEPGHRQTWDIITQRIDAGGSLLWQSEGVPLEITKSNPNAVPMSPELTGDGSGGVIIIWRDTRRDAAGEASVYAQRIDENGNLLWQAGGVKVSSTSLNPHPQIISDNSGGAIISYSFQADGRILRLQKLDGDGNRQWQENGISITEKGFAGYSIAPDGIGGVIIGWGVSRSTFGSEKAYVQRVNADGELLWGTDETALNSGGK